MVGGIAVFREYCRIILLGIGCLPPPPRKGLFSKVSSTRWSRDLHVLALSTQRATRLSCSFHHTCHLCQHSPALHSWSFLPRAGTGLPPSLSPCSSPPMLAPLNPPIGGSGHKRPSKCPVQGLRLQQGLNHPALLLTDKNFRGSWSCLNSPWYPEVTAHYPSRQNFSCSFLFLAIMISLEAQGFLVKLYHGKVP